MESKIITAISDKAIANDIILEEDKGLYLYGLKKLIFSLLGIVTSLAVGITMNMLIEVIIYIGAYMALRSYAGGYHAKTPIRCYVLSNLIVVLALITVNYMYPYTKICIYVLAISTIIIMKLAPIEAKNKPLEPIEVIVYRRKAITTLWILVLIAILLLFLDLHIYFASIVVAIMCVSIMLILGKYLIE